MSDVSLPSPPNLAGELMLDVFTHPSLRTESGGGDNGRYTVLGEKVLQAAATFAIFLRCPQFREHEIVEEREKQLSDENFERWITFYGFRAKIRCNPTAHSEVNSPKGARDLFHAVVGGAYTQSNGHTIVNNWIYNLIAPPESRVVVKQEFSHQPPPPSVPYPMAPPPPPVFPPYTRSRANSVSGRQDNTGHDDNGAGFNNTTTGKIIFLPRFNEICTQRRFNVEYPAEHDGPQHAPRWVVTCMVDGVQRGQGAGTTKQLAKEEAAKQAWFSFGWSMP